MARNLMVRRSFRGRSSPGRLTEWFASAVQTDYLALPANTVVLDQSLTTIEKAKRPFTVTRVVGSLFLQSDQNAAVETPFGAFGMIVVTEAAVAAGIASIPNVYSSAENDGFFVHQFMSAEGSASTNVGRPLERFSFDFRSQRKVQDGEDIAVVLQNGNLTDGLDYLVSFRMLVKLS